MTATINWSKIKLFGTIAIIAVLIGLYTFSKVEMNEQSLVHEQNEKVLKAKIEMLEEQAEEREVVIRELKIDVDIANETRDSLTALVDTFEPEIINTIEYITDGLNNGDTIGVERAKQTLIAHIETMRLERVELKSAIDDRDQLILLQGKQIDNLNRQIGLLVESKEELILTNKQLKKQIRREVRKRRLTLVASGAAIVGIIFITSR
jgi:uncharacterized membrane-anchored protein